LQKQVKDKDGSGKGEERGKIRHKKGPGLCNTLTALVSSPLVFATSKQKFINTLMIKKNGTEQNRRRGRSNTSMFIIYL
jgi:hypothetical protein